jgi:hypothetical protein
MHKIIVCELGQEPKIVNVEALDLGTMQALVGGMIECVGVAEGVDLWFNEEGHLKQLPFNRDVVGVDNATWGIMGNLFVCGADEEEGESIGLTYEQIKFWMARLELPVVEVPEIPEGVIGVFHAKHPNFAGSYMWDIQPPPPWPTDFEQVALVLTEDINKAYEWTNHLDSPWQENVRVKALTDRARSSSVGDVFVLPDGKAMRVDSCGFVEVV